MDGTSPTEFADLLTLATDSVGAIEEQQDTIQVHYANGVIKFPSKVTFSDVNWNLNCYCSPNVLQALRDWKNLIYDSETEKMGLPSEYMRTAYFIKYDGQGNVRDVIKCPGVWISSLKNGEMNQQGGDLVKISCTLVISKAIYLKQTDL